MAAAIGASLAWSGPVQAQWQEPGASTRLEADSETAIAQTQAGRVQGFVKNAISTFRGIPYAQAERFEAPRPPESWDGVRKALSYGNICPQSVSSELREPQTFTSDQRHWPQSENCLALNVWTPQTGAGNRPVMVWFHGGGYFSGSSIELPAYDGENLSGLGDVVVVTVNHRLNILGHLDLSAYGDEFASSGNAGLVDLVASLEWVRDNISAFGGDPDNVTIFGQSGGGGKVRALMTAPSAEGLFDKAIVMSGAMSRGPGPGAGEGLSQRVAQYTFRYAGLEDGDIAALQALPYDQLQSAGARALAEVSREVTGAPVGGPLGFPVVNWGPVADGEFLPELPFEGGAPQVSATVPLMVGSTLSEFQHINPRISGYQDWSDDRLRQYLQESAGADTETLIAAFRRAYPDLPLSEIVAVDPGGRAGALEMAQQKASQPAPVYNYLFAWRSQLLNSTWSAGHTADVPFVFNNAEAGVQSTGGGPIADWLTNVMARAWINFARTGNPNHDGMGAWPQFTAEQPATMIFDVNSQARVGHDGELIELLNRPQAGRR